MEKNLRRPDNPTRPKQNHLLAALPAADYERLLPHLEAIHLPLGWVVYESGSVQGYEYFPTDSIVSLLYVMDDGFSAEIAVVGNEGLVGISLFMGGDTTPSRAVVQSAGEGYRVKASVLKKEFALGAELQHLSLRYTQALMTQMAQTALCNRHHSVDQQLCRWLLLSMDRLPGNERSAEYLDNTECKDFSKPSGLQRGYGAAGRAQRQAGFGCEPGRLRDGERTDHLDQRFRVFDQRPEGIESRDRRQARFHIPL